MESDTKGNVSTAIAIDKTNPVLEVIYSRRSIRKYKDLPVDRKSIETLINAGRMAPSAVNMQPWKFYVLTDRELIKSFSKEISKASLKGFSRMGAGKILKMVASSLIHPQRIGFFREDDFIFHGAPVVIFISAPKDNEWAGLDIGACAQNIMLAAKSVGLDSCPVGLAKFVNETKIYSKLNVPDSDHVLLAVIAGYGDERPAENERKINNLFFIK